MNICMVGYGMMGVWHSEALLKEADMVLHTAVGRRADGVRAFAERFGYKKWTVSLEEALADPAIDIVILATPSDQHEAQAIQCLEAGKHTLIEIPIAMSLKGAERVVAAGERSGKVYGLSHPMRFRREREGLIKRTRAGEEKIRHIAGRFFIKRLINIGATGYKRSWTDNILWHHFCHFVDLGLFLFNGVPVRCVQSYMGKCHELTGIPMECVVLVDTEADQSLVVHGSYHATYRFYDKLIVTGRDTYFYDILAGTLRTAEGTTPIEDEQTNAAHVITDFLAAVRENRPPLASGPSVLPAMRVLQAVQDAWDAEYGAQSIPGRPVG
ncbi:MAG: Gfo/Idh/MocA family oxidoreductase [Acetobacteraceae bacterium]|nr:Gfo/Idh/MocA family oxidoreductase [Acetobacteraceae bacterium]MBV8525034.1 Gfo/Idh/MocA family oxidoreductase [Acetobacteraceae bacterium]